MECSRPVACRACMNQKSPPMRKHTFVSSNLILCPHWDPDMWVVAAAMVPLQSSKGSSMSNNARNILISLSRGCDSCKSNILLGTTRASGHEVGG